MNPVIKPGKPRPTQRPTQRQVAPAQRLPPLPAPLARALSSAVPCGKECEWRRLVSANAYRCERCGTGMTQGWLERQQPGQRPGQQPWQPGVQPQIGGGQ